jgi:hypothetical protein
MRVLAAVAICLGLGCSPYDHHVADPGRRPTHECETARPHRQRSTPGYPGLVITDPWYGGTASWTHEGDPPAGDACPPIPSGVTPRHGE